MDLDLDRYDSRRSTVYANEGVVATSQPLATQAGVEALQDGGNAFDAAVATAATLAVVEPASTGVGGDVFACFRTADGEVGGMRACGRGPSGTDIHDLRERFGGDGDPSMPLRDPHVITPPGSPAGWEATVERYGDLAFERVLRPAIRHARDGYPVTPIIARQWETIADAGEFQNDAAREQYLIDGHAPEAGEVIALPELAGTLESLAEAGSEVVYDGPVGEQIVETVRAAGGPLRERDLDAVEVEWLDPVSTTYHGTEVYELPPNNQGLIVLEALNVADELDAAAHPRGSLERVHRFVEATKLAYHDGHRYITDPDEGVPDLASREYARERALDVGHEATDDPGIGFPGTDHGDGDTVLLTVADAAGNVVSFINSLFHGFGSGYVAGDTGVRLQNRGASFSLDPDHPNSFASGKRPFHTLIPGLARFDADDWAAFGVMGGYMQPQGHVQVLSGLVDDGLSLQAALDAPRWYYRETGRLSVEARYDDVLATGLERRGHDVDVAVPELFGGGQLARWRDGVLSAATEPRNDGAASGF